MDRRRLPPVTHTDAPFANQSQSILDKLMELLGQSSAWNGSEMRILCRLYSWASAYARHHCEKFGTFWYLPVAGPNVGSSN
jgi:hypothetical protein